MIAAAAIIAAAPASTAAAQAPSIRTAGGQAAAAASGTSQPAAPASPRIGLALGGGSARGMAHIGVLQWFEEHRIPIDVIVGTSMGGLVGGAYADQNEKDHEALVVAIRKGKVKAVFEEAG